MSMSDDDLYLSQGDPNDTTYYPDEPMARREAEVSDKAIQAASYPILGDVAAWFEEQINKCNDIDNIVFDTQVIAGVQLDRHLSVEAQVLAYRLLKEKLQDKYSEFKDFRHER